MAKTEAPNTGNTLNTFTGFKPEAFKLLNALAKNNNREWFLENKTVYDQELRAPMAALVETLALGFAARDIPLTGDAKKSLFRVNRDVRFSHNKEPYKTNVSAVLSRDGSKTAQGLLYLQLGGSEGAFVASGFYAMEPPSLAAFRQAIANKPEKWLAVTAGLEQSGFALGSDDALKRMPKGFEHYQEEAIASALKQKHFVITQNFSKKSFENPDIVIDIIKFAETARPLLDFGWKAIQGSVK